MEITGTVYKILPIQSGESKTSGNWTKQEIVIETEGQYPKKVCITCFGKVVDNLDVLKTGAKIKAHINIESREYNERWYTEVKAWKVEFNATVTAPSKEDASDDLPF